MSVSKETGDCEQEKDDEHEANSQVASRQKANWAIFIEQLKNMIAWPYSYSTLKMTIFSGRKLFIHGRSVLDKAFHRQPLPRQYSWLLKLKVEK